MRIALIPLLMVLSVAGCGTPTMTRQDLVGRMGGSYAYRGSRFLYMGRKEGYDFVTHRWDNYRGHAGERVFRFRVGELPVGTSMEFAADETLWREFNPLTK